MVALLLGHAAVDNERANNSSMSLLMRAVLFRHAEVMGLLLKRGIADVKAVSNHGHVAVVARLLSSSSVDIEERNA